MPAGPQRREQLQVMFSRRKSKAPLLLPSALSSAEKEHLEGPSPPRVSESRGAARWGQEGGKEGCVGQRGARPHATREFNPCGRKLISESVSWEGVKRGEGLGAKASLFCCPF